MSPLHCVRPINLQVFNVDFLQFFNFQFALPHYFAVHANPDIMTKTVNFGHKDTHLTGLPGIFVMSIDRPFKKAWRLVRQTGSKMLSIADELLAEINYIASSYRWR